MADGRKFRIGAVLAETARVLRWRPATFLLIALIPVPVAGIFVPILWRIVSGRIEAGSSWLFQTLFVVTGFTVVLSAFLLAQAMITFCAFESCSGRDFAVRTAVRRVLRRALSLVGLTCLGASVFIGWYLVLREFDDADPTTFVRMVVVLVIVVVFVGVRHQAKLFVTFPVTILENVGLIASMKRSTSLAKEFRGGGVGIFATLSSAIVGTPLLIAAFAVMQQGPIVILWDILVLLWAIALSPVIGLEVAVPAAVGIGILDGNGYSGLIIVGFLVLFVVPALVLMGVLTTVTYADLRQAEERRGSEGDEIAHVFD